MFHEQSRWRVYVKLTKGNQSLRACTELSRHDAEITAYPGSSLFVCLLFPLLDTGFKRDEGKNYAGD